jgi:hypothetical protein
MAIPTTREQFKQTCLRALGHPVVRVNVDDDQIEDRIDYALSYYADYHFDATERMYFKHEIKGEDFPQSVKDIWIHDGGLGYSNTDTVTFGAVSRGTGAQVQQVITDSSGMITSIPLANNGYDYAIAPTATINTSTGTGANVEPRLGGWITLPDNIMGVTGLFDLSNSITNISNMFSIQYQIALNEIWSLSSYSMVPYYMTIQHLNLIQQLLVGQQPIRFSRHRNMLFLDMALERLAVGNYIILDCYQVIDPNEFVDVWKDRWLQRYCTEQIKLIWGNNMKKFGNMEMPGRVTFNGQAYYDEARAEIQKLEDEMINSYSLPCSMLIG